MCWKNKKETWIVVSNIFQRRKTGIYSIFFTFKKSSWARTCSAKSRLLGFERYILFWTIYNCRVIYNSKYTKGQLFLEKYQKHDNSEDHEETKNVPYFFTSYNCLRHFKSGCRDRYFCQSIIRALAMCEVKKQHYLNFII